LSFVSLPVRLTGLLGEAQSLSESRRLKEFIEDSESEALALFDPSHRADSRSGDWYGEHAGKWLVAAARAALRNPSPDWNSRLEGVLLHLRACQEEDGYLGAYAQDAACRFTHPDAPKNRTWDIWVHAWAILGLTECCRIDALRELAEPIATKIGGLLLNTFHSEPGAALRQGNHGGLSSLVILEPLTKLSRLTGNPAYARLALGILEAAESHGLAFLTLPPKDVSEIGTGKIYQIIWCLQGILDLADFLDRPDLAAAVEAHWTAIGDRHLTPYGGPWGGIGGHKEVFNSPGFFHPGGLVETCSSATWLTLTQAMFLRSGDPRFLAEIEKTALNAILGAMDANGRDWCYFTFPNGRRNNTYHWACCKSSGAMALEACSQALLVEEEGTLSICQWWPFETVLPDGRELRLELRAGTVFLSASQATNLRLFVPEWATTEFQSGSFIQVTATPEGLAIPFTVPPQVIPHTHTVDHHGQEIVREDYACVRMGPFVFATGKFDGYAAHRTLRLPRLNPESTLKVVDDHAIDLIQAGCKPIRLEPYCLAGGRHDGGWRTTWLEVAWQ
jgi:uncharacterized protein